MKPLELKRDIYDRCYLIMCLMGYEGMPFEKAAASKIVAAHYIFVGYILMARFVDSRNEVGDIMRQFLNSIDNETKLSLRPLCAVLGHLFGINAISIFDYVEKKGGQS